MREIMLIRIGLYPLGVDLSRVKAVQRRGDLDMIEASGEEGRRVRFPDGEVLPLHDIHGKLHRVFFPEAEEPPEWESAKILRLTHHDAGKGLEIALGVDEAERVVDVPAEAVDPLPPAFGRTSLDWFPEILTLDERLILLLNPGGIVKEMAISEGTCSPERPAASTPGEVVPDGDGVTAGAAAGENLPEAETDEDDLEIIDLIEELTEAFDGVDDADGSDGLPTG